MSLVNPKPETVLAPLGLLIRVMQTQKGALKTKNSSTKSTPSPRVFGREEKLPPEVDARLKKKAVFGVPCTVL